MGWGAIWGIFSEFVLFCNLFHETIKKYKSFQVYFSSSSVLTDTKVIVKVLDAEWKVYILF